LKQHPGERNPSIRKIDSKSFQDLTPKENPRRSNSMEECPMSNIAVVDTVFILVLTIDLKLLAMFGDHQKLRIVEDVTIVW
jgi:hypothetical protein